MFRHRRTHSNPQAINQNPNPSATSAAAQAFLAHQASSSSLSSAAAAQALRTFTTSPTPVGELQTKRNLQRQLSNSSNGSAGRSILGPAPGPSLHLRRQNSLGSMADRTFRSPSPNGRGSPRSTQETPPPVPAIPPVIPSRSHRRAASAGPTNTNHVFPPPNKSSGRGSSLDRGVAPNAAPARIAARLVATPPRNPEENRASINFSYPMGSQSPSPTKGKGRSSPLPLAGPEKSHPYGTQTTIQNAPEKPAKKKKRSSDKATAEGSHFPIESSLDNSSQSSPASTPRRKKKASTDTPPTSSEKPSPKREPLSLDTGWGSEEKTSVGNVYTARPGGVLAKKPSVVHEERELEELEDGPHSNSPHTQRDGIASNHQKSASEPLTSVPFTTDQIESSALLTHPPSQSPSSPRGHYSLENSLDLRPDQSLINSKKNSLEAWPASGSPARTAHFASNLLVSSPGQTIHQPPLRSISPAKSAMKGSHSQSPRSGSPASASWIRTHAQTPSEASETNSLISEEGSRGMSSGRRRKNVRVSFDEDSVIYNRNTNGATDPEPQSLQTTSTVKGNTNGVGRGSNQESEGENSAAMTPRPALPSFGSVRGRREKGGEESMKVAESIIPSSSTSLSTSPVNERITTDLSTDRLVGSVIARDFAVKNSPKTEISLETKSPKKGILQHPIPPEVTSVEGHGYASDSDGSANGNDSTLTLLQKSAVVLNGNAMHANSSASITRDSALTSNQQQGLDVPSIAVQGATPTIEESTAMKDWLSMPGGFPTREQEEVQYVSVNKQPTTTLSTSKSLPQQNGAARTSPNESTSPYASPSALESLAEQDSGSDDTGSSIYSDAPEEFSSEDDDNQGSGFASIDAVVTRPPPLITDTTPGLAITTPPESPKILLPKTTFPQHNHEIEPSAEEGWEKAQAYWSGLSDQKRTELERAAVITEYGADTPRSETTAKPKTAKKTKGKERVGPVASLADLGITKDVLSANTNGMRKSMRRKLESPNAGPSLPNKTLKGGALRKSHLNVQKPRETLQQQQNGYQAPLHIKRAPSPLETPSRVVTTISANASKKKPTLMANLRHTTSNGSDSDSSSSFKRLRQKSLGGGGMSMRRTMRGSSMPAHSSSMAERPASRAGSSRFSMRSLSPTAAGPIRPFSSSGDFAGGQGSMRASLRGSMDSPPSKPLRASLPPRKESSSRFSGFGKSKSAGASKSKSRFSSRFADSSDDEAGPLQFRSRYADSSDDETPAAVAPRPTLTPVRGIPKRAGVEDGESSDLPDSSEDEGKAAVKAANSIPKGKLPMNTPSPAPAASTTLRRLGSVHTSPTRASPSVNDIQIGDRKKKRSLFGTLSRRKDSSSKIRKSDIESAARRDTPLERSKLEIKAMRAGVIAGPSSPPPAAPAASPIVSPRLVKRAAPKRIFSDTWPLPSPPEEEYDDQEEEEQEEAADARRPKTSDGVVLQENSLGGQGDFGASHPAPDISDTVVRDVDGAVVGKKGKKKKFPFLRKVFGLDN
ncbi:MAG: hypothetical protein M1829_005849 [Trizodia sp. TS-e1964]|nr:MAG: hypothetical protein M1829_005849 [Trizodia sp. TS-e1964]